MFCERQFSSIISSSFRIHSWPFIPASVAAIVAKPETSIQQPSTNAGAMEHRKLRTEMSIVYSMARSRIATVTNTSAWVHIVFQPKEGKPFTKRGQRARAGREYEITKLCRQIGTCFVFSSLIWLFSFLWSAFTRPWMSATLLVRPSRRVMHHYYFWSLSSSTNIMRPLSLLCILFPLVGNRIRMDILIDTWCLKRASK